jgi:hypothetical protein
VNIQDVKDILQTLQIGKACGNDGISHQMLKATSETICWLYAKPYQMPLIYHKIQ